MAYYRKPGATAIMDEQGKVITDPNVMSSIGDISQLPLYGNQQSPVTTANVPMRAARTTDPLSQLKQQLASGISSQLNSPDSAISERENINSLFSARLADIQQRVSQRLAAEQEAGRRAEAQATGVNLRAGLAGSDFAASRRTGVQNQTKANVEEINQWGQSQKDALYAQQEIAVQNIEDRANQRAQERLGLIEKSIGLLEQEQGKALTDWQTLAKSGLPLEQIKTTPMYEEIIDQTGKDPSYLDLIYTQLWGEANAIKWEDIKTSRGDIIRLGKDKDGNIVKKEVISAKDLGIPDDVEPTFFTNEMTGQTYFYDKNSPELDASGNLVMKPVGKTQMTLEEENAMALEQEKAKANIQAGKEMSVAAYKESLNKDIAGGTSTVSSVSSKNLTATDRSELATMDTAMQMANNLIKLGEGIGWEGVGGLWRGSLSQFLAQNFGKGEPKEQELRSMIGNVRATIAKLRGGTSFTANEEKLLNTYTPGIDDDPMVIKSKVKALNDFITLKKNTVMGNTSQQNQAQPGEIMVKDKATGQLGYIPENEFDPNIYEKQ